MRKSIEITVCLMLFLVAACSSERRNSNGDLLPTFEEYTVSSVEDGSCSVNIRYQRIANTDSSDVLKRIDAMNYAHTFDEFALYPADVEESVRLLVAEYATNCADGEECDCLGCSYSLDQQVFLGRNDSVLCYETCVEIYSGGAHGGDALLYDCYDLATGGLYDFSYLTDGEWAAAVQALIYDRLNEVCDDVLFVASPESVYIPRSVKITENGLLLVYQPYEVASFDAGIISVELTDEELLYCGAPLVWVDCE